LIRFLHPQGVPLSKIDAIVNGRNCGNETTWEELPESVAVSGDISFRGYLNAAGVIYFNSTVNSSNLDSLLSFQVDTNQIYFWAVDNSVYFGQRDSLRVQKTYQIDISQSLKDSQGNLLDKTYKIGFGTEALRINYVQIMGQTFDTLSALDGKNFNIAYPILFTGSLGLRLTFNRRIDTASIGSLLSLEPSIPMIEDIYRRYYDERRTFRMSEYLKPESTYVLTMYPGIKDIKGDPLTDTTKITFTMEPFFSTGGFLFDNEIPQDPSRPIKVDASNIRQFTTALDIGSALGFSSRGALLLSLANVGLVGRSRGVRYSRFSSYQSYLDFNIPIDSNSIAGNMLFDPDSGMSYKYDSTRIQISAADFLVPEKHYSITVTTGLKSIYGDTLKRRIELEFDTQKFELIGVNRFGDSVSVEDSTFTLLSNVSTRNLQIDFLFNYALDLNTVLANFSTTPSIPAQIFADVNRINLDANAYLIPSTSYKISVNNSLKETFGHTLSHGFDLNFTTEAFKVHTYREYLALSKGLWQLYFNSSISIDSLVNHIAVEPTSKYGSSLQISYVDSSDNTSCLISSDSIPALGETIVLKIDSSFTDIHSKKLTAGFIDSTVISSVLY